MIDDADIRRVLNEARSECSDEAEALALARIKLTIAHSIQDQTIDSKMAALHRIAREDKHETQ